MSCSRKAALHTLTFQKHLIIGRKMARGRPPTLSGLEDLPCEECLKDLGLSILEQRWLQVTLQQSSAPTRGVLSRCSQVHQEDAASCSKTRDNGQNETRAVLTGYREKSLSPCRKSSIRAGCPQCLCSLCPWRFSRPTRIKPRATWSGPITGPA